MQHTYSRVEIEERITSEDFFARATDRPQTELIDGIVIAVPPPVDVHERLRIFLLCLLGEHVESCDLGEVRGSRTAVRLADDQTYEPDLLFISRDRLSILQESGVFGAPDLVVEILSASTASYDRGPKLRTYDRSGVREVWLIDPYGPTGSEFHLRQDLGLRPVMPADGTLISPVLGGFRLRTEWLWPTGKFIAVREALLSAAPERS
ncbi:MAG TPA: Uma2 family endonuclease [Thermoanaerobaculia bacterium]